MVIANVQQFSKFSKGNHIKFYYYLHMKSCGNSIFSNFLHMSFLTTNSISIDKNQSYVASSLSY
jgi:hypothetical protein